MWPLLLAMSIAISSPPDNLWDVAVWVSHLGILTPYEAYRAAYIKPQYCRRGWIKWAWLPYNFYTDPEYNLWVIPQILNDSGALLAGGVQVSELWKIAGWPWDNPYDDDHRFPYEIPDPVFYDWATRNTEGEIYRIPFINCEDTLPRTWISIANENVWDLILYASYHQIDAGVNVLDYDAIHGGYKFKYNAQPGDNPNTGYDDYHLGTANFATRLSVIVTYDTIRYFMPTPSASSNPDSASYAFDDNQNTYWRSTIADSHWIEIDLGRKRTIQQIYLYLLACHVLRNFKIKYWNDTTGWTDFSPPINVKANTDTIRSFLVTPVATSKIRLSSTDKQVYLPELKIFGQGFRQYLLKKYCIDSGWTPTDPRWVTQKLVDLSDTLQCPDGTMNSFNYRGYLKSHGWVYNPFGGPIDTTNYLNPPNPLFLDWFPFHYFTMLYFYFLDDSIKVETIVNLYKRSFTYQTVLRLLDYIYKGVTTYAEGLGKTIYFTHSHSALGLLDLQRCDHILLYIVDAPTYPAPSPTDTLKTHLDGTRALVNPLRLLRRRALAGYDEPPPIVAFFDHGFGYFPFAHIGGIDEPADERVECLKTYTWEIYASGIYFSLPTKYPGWDAWADTTSDGTPIIEVVKHCADFINRYQALYRNIRMNPTESHVKVNGIVPFNGDWNHGRSAPVNESKVTITYMDVIDGTKSYLHIINHNWDSLAHHMVPQDSVPLEIPVNDSCIMVRLVSPDLPHEDTLPFTYQDGVIKCTLPKLIYYDVLILDLCASAVEKDTCPNHSMLYPSVPNPFISSTTIKYSIAKPAYVELRIYNLTGQLVKTLTNTYQQAGIYEIEWPGEDENGKPLPSGIYFLQLKVNSKVLQTNKLLLLKQEG